MNGAKDSIGEAAASHLCVGSVPGYSEGAQGAVGIASPTPASKSRSATTGPLRMIYLDYRRYRAVGAKSAVAVIGLTQGFWASVVFRLSHWAITRLNVPGLHAIINALCLIVSKLTEIVTGIDLPSKCIIGPGLYIGHFGGIILDGDCRMGENCNLSQGVTIGLGGRGDLRGVPTIGDRVHIGANAVVLGKITIGDDAVIGPGAVAMSSLPPRAVAVGNPARVVGYAGSFEFILYDGMEGDPARKLALQS